MKSEWQECVANLLHEDKEARDKECPYCGEIFTPKWVKPDANHCLGRWQVFCSQTCAKLGWEERRDDSKESRPSRSHKPPLASAAISPDKAGCEGIIHTFAELRKTLTRAYKIWTPEEEEILRSDFQQGRTIKEIAARLERKPGGIHARLIRQGLIEK